MEYNTYVKYFIGNFIYFTISLILIFLNQKYSAINISSPLMLTISNLFLFLMNSSLISYELVEKYNLIEEYKISFCQVIPFLFIIGYNVVFISLYLRIKRFINSIRFNKVISHNKKNKADIFYSNRYVLDERYYCKICTLLIMFVLLFVGYFYWKYQYYIPVPYFFMKYFTNNLNDIITLEFINNLCTFYMIIYCTQGFILLISIYKLITANLVKKIKFELFIQILLFLCIFISSNYYYNKDKNQNQNDFSKISFIFILISILFVFFNTYLPIIRALSDKIKTNYSFNPKLATNLYLFLSDEICYYSFSDYLKDSQIDSFYICLYTKIMKFKYKFSLEANLKNVIEEAKILYENYFDVNSNNKYMKEEILNKIRNTCSKYISKDDCSYEMFDEALVCVYEYLQKRFNEFIKSEEYKLLTYNLNMNSYIQYKVCSYSKMNSVQLSTY